MRYSVLLASALIGLAVPALAQDHTLPAGALDALRSPVAEAPAPVFQGRSVYTATAPVVHVRRLHHRG